MKNEQPPLEIIEKAENPSGTQDIPIAENDLDSIGVTNKDGRNNITSKERREDSRYLKEVTPISINSLETIFSSQEEQKIIRELVGEYNNKYKYNKTKQEKIFRILNGKELTYGDIVVINKLIDLKVFRDDNGKLMMFDKDKNEFVPFNPTKFSGQHKSFTFKDNIKDVKNPNNRAKYSAIPLESFAPEIFKMNFFKEDDFDKRYAGSPLYQVEGPHERKLSHTNPYAVFSNDNGYAKYYLGRENFVGTNKKINHETVRVSMLDENTVAITDTIHGKKVILYTFPLINEEEYKKKKEEVVQRRLSKDEPVDINLNDYITVNTNKLNEYSITDYFPKNINESETDYANRISKLSDTSYVLGNFRSFMSKTGLAANNYSWREQLLLSDTLTKVEDESKIFNFGKKFGYDGMRTFLSIEQGGREMGDKILALGDEEKLSRKVAEEIFSKYGEIIDTANNTEEILKDILPEKVVNGSQNEIREIRESLLVRAKDLLSTFHDKKEKDSGGLLKDLDRYKSEILLIGDTYKKLKQSGKEVKLEDIKNIKITILSQEEKEKIGGKLWDITKANRPFIKDGTKEMKEREENFFSTIKNEDSSFYVLKYGDKNDIVAFCSFTPDENGDLYAESLNIESEIKGSKIGGEFFPNVLEKVKNFGKDIYGHVHPENSSILNYYKGLGFEIKEVKEGEELKYYEIRIPVQIDIKLVA